MVSHVLHILDLYLYVKLKVLERGAFMFNVYYVYMSVDIAFELSGMKSDKIFRIFDKEGFEKRALYIR